VTIVAAACLVAAVFLMRPAAPRWRLARLQPRPQQRSGPRRRQLWWPPTLVVLATSVGLLLGGTAGASVAFSVALVVGTVLNLVLRQRRQHRAWQRAESIAESSQLLAGLLRVGHVPGSALRLASAETDVFAEATAAQRVGGSLTATWRRQSLEPGSEGLAELAAAWQVCEGSGASLTDTLDALADHLDSVRRLDRVVAAELSAPKATGRMLAALPFAGLALGFAVGGDPVAFLIGSPVGQLCLVTGVALACAGVWWMERIARSAGNP